MLPSVSGGRDNCDARSQHIPFPLLQHCLHVHGATRKPALAQMLPIATMMQYVAYYPVSHCKGKQNIWKKTETDILFS
jgi:hypothetical protein